MDLVLKAEVGLVLADGLGFCLKVNKLLVVRSVDCLGNTPPAIRRTVKNQVFGYPTEQEHLAICTRKDLDTGKPLPCSPARGQ